MYLDYIYNSFIFNLFLTFLLFWHLFIRFKLVPGCFVGGSRNIRKDMLKTCWRGKHGETVQRTFTGWFGTYCIYICCFLDLMQVPRALGKFCCHVFCFCLADGVFRYFPSNPPLKTVYTSWRFWVLCEWKISFKTGSLRCVKYTEKKPNLTILTSLKSQVFFINHGSQHSTLFQKSF